MREIRILKVHEVALSYSYDIHVYFKYDRFKHVSSLQETILSYRIKPAWIAMS